MRIPNHRDADAGRSDSAMTPMIDVVFLLLIFFICTASFQIAEQFLPSTLSVAAGSSSEEPEVPPELEDLQNVVVKIRWVHGSPAWRINDRDVATLHEVRQTLAAAAAVDAKLPVILDVAGEVPLGHGIDVYDAGRAAGFKQIQFAASIAP